MNEPRIAVLLPCLNEAHSIAQVVEGFRQSLSQATIYVYDNGSSDDTSARAQAAGAIVRREPERGKGNVVRRMFADIDADIYILADGDHSHDCGAAPELLRCLLQDQLDMVVGGRQSDGSTPYRAGHRMGNRLFTRLVNLLFHSNFRDILSGYRVLSRRFVKSFPALSRGFEIETELTIHAAVLRMPWREVSLPHRERPAESTSKLSTWRDGLRILGTILLLLKEERPAVAFTAIAAALAMLSLGLAWPIFVTFIETGLVPRFPTAILSSALMTLAFGSVVCGIILDSVTRGRRETKRMHYLRYPPPPAAQSE